LQFIKDSAFAERVKTTVSPPTETLERQIRRLTVQLNIERASAHKYQALIEAILDKITEINRSEDIDQRYALDEFSAWLADRFND
jgi:DNA primase large subunit